MIIKRSDALNQDLSDAVTEAVPTDGVDQLLSNMEAMHGPWQEGDFRVIARLLFNASLNYDEATLRRLEDWLQWAAGRKAEEDPALREERGRLLGLIDVADFALRHVYAHSLAHQIDPDTHAARVLALIDSSPGISNSNIAWRLSLDITEVSRIGRHLKNRGLAINRKIGRHNHWEITPRGRASLPNKDYKREGEDDK